MIQKRGGGTGNDGIWERDVSGEANVSGRRAVPSRPNDEGTELDIGTSRLFDKIGRIRYILRQLIASSSCHKILNWIVTWTLIESNLSAYIVRTTVWEARVGTENARTHTHTMFFSVAKCFSFYQYGTICTSSVASTNTLTIMCLARTHATFLMWQDAFCLFVCFAGTDMTLCYVEVSRPTNTCVTRSRNLDFVFCQAGGRAHGHTENFFLVFLQPRPPHWRHFFFLCGGFLSHAETDKTTLWMRAC